MVHLDRTIVEVLCQRRQLRETEYPAKGDAVQVLPMPARKYGMTVEQAGARLAADAGLGDLAEG